MLMRWILFLSAAGALGLTWGAGAFSGLTWLWLLPLSFAGLWLGLVLLAFLALILWCLPIRMDRPVERDSPVCRKILYLYEEFALSLLRVRIQTSGLERVPQSGRFLLVCNHTCILDPLVLHVCLPRAQLSFISKRENDRLFVVNKLMHKTLCQSINRENDREALRTILRCVELLQQDQVSIAVFPEGYTSKDGILHPFRNGVFKIAQKAQVPIVVCTLQNTRPVFHNAVRLRRTRVRLDVLEVLPAESLKGPTKDVGDRIHGAMERNLTG